MDEYIGPTGISRAEAERRLMEAAGVKVPAALQVGMAVGCERCGGKGYKGRMGVYEILENSPELRDLIQRRARTAEINGRPIRFDAVTMPVLSVSAERDTIAPADGVDAIAQLIPHARVIRLPGGHVGVVAGRTALALWDTTVEFLRDAERADHGSGS